MLDTGLEDQVRNQGSRGRPAVYPPVARIRLRAGETGLHRVGVLPRRVMKEERDCRV